MPTEPALPKAAEPAHLTKVFRRAGLLSDGTVREIQVESARNTVLSRITRLRLSYDAANGAPQTLILKTGLPERLQSDSGRLEVAFYDQVGALTPPGLLPRCYDAAWEGEGKPWHLLLEDLTDTHVIATAWPLPPSRTQCERIIRARARFHAAWWDDPRLGVDVGAFADAIAIKKNVQLLAERFARFAEKVGDDLPRERRALFESLIVAAPQLRTRYLSRRHVTIIHWDSHFWNCFLAKDPTSDDVRLFDWDAWRLDIASEDLAYMMAMHWYPERRRELEHPLLDCYHDELIRRGVKGYSREMLDEDYRLSVLWRITTPVTQALFNIPPVVWWNNLERILLAVDDLGCRELLQ